jgi:hypothetical protein
MLEKHLEAVGRVGEAPRGDHSAAVMRCFLSGAWCCVRELLRAQRPVWRATLLETVIYIPPTIDIYSCTGPPPAWSIRARMQGEVAIRN